MKSKSPKPMYNICCREAYPTDCETHGDTAWLRNELDPSNNTTCTCPGGNTIIESCPAHGWRNVGTGHIEASKPGILDLPADEQIAIYTKAAENSAKRQQAVIDEYDASQPQPDTDIEQDIYFILEDVLTHRSRPKHERIKDEDYLNKKVAEIFDALKGTDND